MQKNNEEQIESVEEDVTKEASYGGFQYKHNYDEYKKELIEKQVKKQGRWLNVLICVGFAVLLSALAVLITDTVLKTKGSSFAELLNGGSSTADIPNKSELTEKAISDLSSRYTVTVTAGEKTGAGIVITKDGYIATCYSLVKNAAVIEVTFKNGKNYGASVAGYDEDCDTAVLKIEASADLTAAEIGYSRLLEPEQTVYCAPSPGSSLIKMSVTSSDDVLYINTEPVCDVCGAPLLNTYGQVVGICSDQPGRVLHMDSMLPFIKKVLNKG